MDYYEKHKDYKKCKNCNQGLSYGGFHKRIEKEVNLLDKKRDNEIGNIKEKNQDKKRIIISEIKNKYEKLANEKCGEEPKRIGKCWKCHGKGYIKIKEVEI